MDLGLNDTEASIVDSLRVLLDRHAGPARAKQLAAAGEPDGALGQALAASGFLDLFSDEHAGPPAAGLVAEEVARAAGTVPIGARTLVSPAAVPDIGLSPLVTVAEAGTTAPVRFAASADWLVLLGEDEARLLARGDWSAVPERSKHGYPIARLTATGAGRGLGPGSAAVARRWWQASLSAEIAGTAQAAVDLTTRYLKERAQFGRPLGAFQALQHRLAECAVQVEGVRWLTREAIALGAPTAAAAAAAVAAVGAARLITQETHQLTGAMGFTMDYDLHVWSLRLQALRVEAGGISRHAEALVTARWGAGQQ
jgi:alkylation response protein AidB-like acyl-CoA dehydrogenase